MARVLNRAKIEDPEPKNRDLCDFSVAGELWERDDKRIEPRVLLAIINPIMVETSGGITATAIALRQCEVLDLIRDLAHEYHQTAHKALEADPD